MKRLAWVGVVGLVAGCFGDDEQLPPADFDASTIADAGAPDAMPPSFTVAPELEMAPSADTPLVGVLTLETDRPTHVTVGMDDGVTTWSIEFDDVATSHTLTILGFRPDRSHILDVRAIDENGAWASAQLEATTPPLPDDFPVIDVLHADESAMEPGLFMFSAAGASNGFIIIVNSAGEVVWYTRRTTAPIDVRRTSTGTILWTRGDRLGAAEIDMQGVVVQRWHAANTTTMPSSTPVAVNAMHHELFEMANGNLLVLSAELRSFDNYPTSPTDPTPRTEPFGVVGDVYVEFQRDGTIVGEWHLLDMLDPYRVAYDSYGGYWNTFFGETVADWSHSNAIIHDPTDDTFIASMRHQDAVIKFDRSGQLIWIFGPHANWTSPWDQYLLDPTTTDFQWQYHQHAPEITPNGILMFDNGVYGASPPDPKRFDVYSRALEVEIDETNMEVRHLWQYTANSDLFSAIVGDADRLPVTGNVLTDFGAAAQPLGEPFPIIVETTHTNPPVEVFRMRINPESNGFIYRVDHIPGLYP